MAVNAKLSTEMQGSFSDYVRLISFQDARQCEILKCGALLTGTKH